MNEQRRPAAERRGAQRILTTKVPAWVVAAAVLVVAAVLGALIAIERSSSVELGPAIGGAQRVEVRLDICNGEVDRRAINPRQAELDLQETLIDEGAEEARVRVERHDCPGDETGEGSDGG